MRFPSYLNQDSVDYPAPTTEVVNGVQYRGPKRSQSPLSFGLPEMNEPALATQTPGSRVDGPWPQTQPPDVEQFLANVPADKVQEYLRLQNAPNVLAQAQALRAGVGRKYNTGWGAALGGLGDAVREGVAGYQTRKANDMLTEGNAFQNPIMRRMASITMDPAMSKQMLLAELLRGTK